MKRSRIFRTTAVLLCLLLWLSAVPAAHAAYYAEVIDSAEDPRIPALLSAVDRQNFTGSGATAASARAIIEYFIFDSPFAAIGGGLFPYPNSGGYAETVTDGTYSAAIPGAAGCYAHCNYMSTLIYGSTGTATEERTYTAEELAALLQSRGQAGEHLRVSGRHSLCLISCDEAGFYALSYQGDTDATGGKIALVFWRYDDFIAKYPNTGMWLFDCAAEENGAPDLCPLGDQCPSLPYTDIPGPGNWAHAGIDSVLQNGWMVGVAEGEFAPGLTMTRAMLVTVLWRMAGEPEAAEPAPFDDVPAESWYAGAVAWAAAEGITAGTAAREFSPALPVTREQTAAILARYAAPDTGREPVPTLSAERFADTEAVSEWAIEAVAQAVEAGWISGRQTESGVYLAPQGEATRAEVAAILTRFAFPEPTEE